MNKGFLLLIMAIFVVACDGNAKDDSAFNHSQSEKLKKAECIKKTPWMTLDGLTLCDTVWDIAKKRSGKVSYREGYDVSDDDGVIAFGTFTGDVRQIEISSHQDIIKDLVKINGKYTLKKTITSKKYDYTRAGYCWGDCISEETGYGSSYSGKRVICRENQGSCLVFEVERNIVGKLQNTSGYLINEKLSNKYYRKKKSNRKSERSKQQNSASNNSNNKGVMRVQPQGVPGTFTVTCNDGSYGTISVDDSLISAVSNQNGINKVIPKNTWSISSAASYICG